MFRTIFGAKQKAATRLSVTAACEIRLSVSFELHYCLGLVVAQFCLVQWPGEEIVPATENEPRAVFGPVTNADPARSPLPVAP